MKKSVAIIILAISTLSIVLVGLLFQKAEIYNPTIYVEEVIVTGVVIGDDPPLKTFLREKDNTYYIEKPDDPGKPHSLTYVEGLQVQVLYAVLPSLATIPTVTFSGDKNSTIATVDPHSGIVMFHDAGGVYFLLRADDNSNSEAKIFLRAELE